jgi:ornithine decarboxylase
MRCTLFGGVIEITEGLRYKILTDCKGRSVPWTIAGPTCDSVDILLRDEMLPEDIQEGDFIYIPNAGAYTTAYASNFNGFPLPDIVVL